MDIFTFLAICVAICFGAWLASNSYALLLKEFEELGFKIDKLQNSVYDLCKKQDNIVIEDPPSDTTDELDVELDNARRELKEAYVEWKNTSDDTKRILSTFPDFVKNGNSKYREILKSHEDNRKTLEEFEKRIFK